MPGRCILAIDQGTTGSRAFVFDSSGKVISSAYQEFRQYYPKPGWVAHDADEIWASCVKVIRDALRKSRIRPEQISAIGITNQRETTVMWDRKSGKPAAKAIVWQCRRTAAICHKLKALSYSEVFRRKTGLVLDPYFSGTKVRWLLDNVKGLRAKAQKGEVCFGTIDSWLIWKLTGGSSHATDMTNASRTLMFNIRTKQWDKELLKILKVPSAILPKVQNSGSVFGKTFADHATGLPSGIPISAVLGDQQAALYGQGCFSAGSMKNTYGTGCFLVLNTDKKFVASKKGLLTTLAADASGKPVYALEGAVFIAGAVIQWLRDELKVIKSSSETEVLIKDLKDTNGVYFVPAFTGLGAPYWDSEARGIICGLTRGANVKHIVRAAVESMAYQTKDVVDVMSQEIQKPIRELNVDGGACRNDFLMQFQAGLLNVRVVRPRMIDTTVTGAAHLAGVTAGLWTPNDLNRFRKRDRVFSPKMSEEQRDNLYQGWTEAVKRART